MDQTVEQNPKTVLVIRKPDRTIHKVPIENKGVLMSMMMHMDPEKKWGIEEMAYDKAMKLPFIDENYVTAGEATELLNEKDQQIAELMAQLEAKNGNGHIAIPVEDERDKKIRELMEELEKKNQPIETAEAKIKRIAAAANSLTVLEILGDDTRVTVKTAADKKIAALTGD